MSSRYQLVETGSRLVGEWSDALADDGRQNLEACVPEGEEYDKQRVTTTSSQAAQRRAAL